MTYLKKLVLLLLVAIPVLGSAQNNMGIGTTSPDSSAVLEIASDSAGLLIPRLTTVQRNGISNPAEGLLIYNSTDSMLQVHTDSVWETYVLASEFIVQINTLQAQLDRLEARMPADSISGSTVEAMFLAFIEGMEGLEDSSNSPLDELLENELISMTTVFFDYYPYYPDSTNEAGDTLIDFMEYHEFSLAQVSGLIPYEYLMQSYLHEEIMDSMAVQPCYSYWQNDDSIASPGDTIAQYYTICELMNVEEYYIDTAGGDNDPAFRSYANCAAPAFAEIIAWYGLQPDADSTIYGSTDCFNKFSFNHYLATEGLSWMHTNLSYTAGYLYSYGAAMAAIKAAGVPLVASAVEIPLDTLLSEYTMTEIVTALGTAYVVAAGASVAQMKSGGVTAEQILTVPMPVDSLTAASYTSTEIIGGVAATSGLPANISNVQALIALSYNLETMRAGGISVTDMLSAGATSATLTADGVLFPNQYSAGISIDTLFANGSSVADLVSTVGAVSEFYGLSYEGGLIFYVDGVDGSGMVAHDVDDVIAPVSHPWGCSGTEIFTTSQALNAGDGNTTDIDASCLSTSIAADYCINLSAAGETDWFLPSLAELQLMHDNLHASGKGSFDDLSPYWSSSEDDANNAQALDFSIDNASSTAKFASGNVRAVRAFAN